MPTNEFDFDEADDRPRKGRRPRDDGWPRRARRPADDEEDRPRKRSAPSPSNGAATAALVLGILGLCTSLLTGIPAIIFGFIGMSKAGTVGTDKGMALTGLLLGLFSTVLALAATVLVAYLIKKGGDNLTGLVEDLKKGGTLTDHETAGKMRNVSLAAHKHEESVARFPNNTAADDVPGAPRNPRRWTPNRPHSNRRVDAYADAGGSADTRFRGLAGAGTVFEPYARLHFAGIPDGTSNTILVVEAADTEKWAEGNDLRYDAGWPEPPTPPAIPAVGRPGSNTALVAMCDGSVRRISKSIDPMAFRRLAGRADGMVVDVPPVVD